MSCEWITLSWPLPSMIKILYSWSIILYSEQIEERSPGNSDGNANIWIQWLDACCITKLSPNVRTASRQDYYITYPSLPGLPPPVIPSPHHLIAAIWSLFTKYTHSSQSHSILLLGLRKMVRLAKQLELLVLIWWYVWYSIYQ